MVIEPRRRKAIDAIQENDHAWTAYERSAWSDTMKAVHF
jgi:hypothetical protein